MIAASASTDVLRDGWLDAASTLAPDIPEIADLLGARLNDAIASGHLTEAELMSTIAEVEETATRVGSSSGNLLARRLRRTVYEYLLALDANLAVEEQHAAAVAETARANRAAAALAAPVPAVEPPPATAAPLPPLPAVPRALSGDYVDTAALFAEFDDPAHDDGGDDSEGRRRLFGFRRRRDPDDDSSDLAQPYAVAPTTIGAPQPGDPTLSAAAASESGAAEPATREAAAKPVAAEPVAADLAVTEVVAGGSPAAAAAPPVADHAEEHRHDTHAAQAQVQPTAFEHVAHHDDDAPPVVAEDAGGAHQEPHAPAVPDQISAVAVSAQDAVADSAGHDEDAAHDARFVAPRAGFHIVEDTDPGQAPAAGDDGGARMFFRNTITNDTVPPPMAPPSTAQPRDHSLRTQTAAAHTPDPSADEPLDAAHWGVRNLNADARRNAEAHGETSSYPVAPHEDPFESDPRLFDLRRKIQDRLRRKRCDEAAALLQMLAQESGGRAVAELAMDAGDRCRGLGKNNAALNCYLAASRADPVFELPLSRLADICIDDQEIDLAVSYLERIARLHRMRGDEKAALRVYRRVVTVAPYRDDILEMLMNARNNGNLGV